MATLNALGFVMLLEDLTAWIGRLFSKIFKSSNTHTVVKKDDAEDLEYIGVMDMRGLEHQAPERILALASESTSRWSPDGSSRREVKKIEIRGRYGMMYSPKKPAA